jgi:hypothetical protein
MASSSCCFQLPDGECRIGQWRGSQCPFAKKGNYELCGQPAIMVAHRDAALERVACPTGCSIRSKLAEVRYIAESDVVDLVARCATCPAFRKGIIYPPKDEVMDPARCSYCTRQGVCPQEGAPGYGCQPPI